MVFQRDLCLFLIFLRINNVLKENVMRQFIIAILSSSRYLSIRSTLIMGVLHLLSLCRLCVAVAEDLNTTELLATAILAP